MSAATEQPKKIVILGGGTAGWMTASLIQKAWGNTGSEILLIESDDIGKIGVGEGSTPSLKLFFEHLGISEQEWMPECNATYKCGISFPNWTNLATSEDNQFSSYIHPFYSQADFKTGSAFIHNTKLRRKGLDVPAHPDKYWLQSALVNADKSPIAKVNLNKKMDYGYHFDSALVGRFLKSRMLKLGVEHLSDTVEKVKLNNTGAVTCLVTKDSGEQSADLFIDCSGFAAILIRKALNVEFKDYSKSLFNDRAIAIQSTIDLNKNIPSKTTSTALSSGWAWNIPLSSRYGNGYVYSSKYISDIEAEKELRAHVGPSCDDFPARVIKMRLGRNQLHWHKNVLAVGLSQGFIEPLEATALMLMQHTVESFINDYQLMLKDNTSLKVQQTSYNTNLNQVFDSIKDYIVAHYKLNTRTDSQYWCDNRNNNNHSPRLAALLKSWDQADGDFEAELTRHNAELTYLAPSWYCLFAGKGRFPEMLTPVTTNTPVAPYLDIEKYCIAVSEHFNNHQQQLKAIYGNKWPEKSE